MCCSTNAVAEGLVIVFPYEENTGREVTATIKYASRDVEM